VGARCYHDVATDFVPSGGTPMPTKSARCQRYALDLFAPNGEAGRWKVHVRPAGRKPPIIVSAQASEHDAVIAAKAIVDYFGIRAQSGDGISSP
jgi:hypothetical protein